MNITVIGSGLPRLTAAANLAQVGHQVTVFEQYHHPGGVTAPSGSHAWSLPNRQAGCREHPAWSLGPATRERSRTCADPL